MYLYNLPTTGAVSFSDFCSDLSLDKNYTRRLQEATQSRANIRALLKENKHVNHADKDNLTLIKLIEEYLPQLLAIMACVAHDNIGLSSEPVFSWRATLSAGMFTPRISVPSFHADLAFLLLTYAFALSNLARSYIFSLGTYEQDRTISDADRKAKDDQLGNAVSFLRRASGIFSYISETLLSEWAASRVGGTVGIRLPPDLTKEVNSALAKMSLAEAQNLAIRKLLSKATYDSNVTPGPPLPKSHPSPMLLAKLHLECSSLYSSARSLIKNFGASKTMSDVHGDISAELRRYLAENVMFHSALAKKWLGVDAGENGGQARSGEAVAFMIWAKKEINELKDGGSSIGRTKSNKNEARNRIALELESINNFYSHYRSLNNTLHFQPVPSQAEVQTRIPVGRLAVDPQPFVPPARAFEPRSLHANESFQEHNNPRNTNIDGESVLHPSVGTYAGAGAYF
ncbi:hypothetical protein AMATHDRAFT_146974 [Amanita thiersii Skay4041]|uniref:pH-response regulator protein palC n=1 Tax=Amanita thiersii Skay4041 TaxID=703135 RepID=A0A2A9NNA2_9AGAR|nr:hypothetical protein AMATHDRAFT_146974 [Amanita thiersii Skay4041]